MTFDKHLFISYAHIDDQPLTPGVKGWVSRFHDSLQAMLGMRTGYAVRIWRDEKLSGIDRFGDEIVRQFPKTALLVSVLSPRYVESDWCTREVREFCQAAEQSGGLVFDNKARVVKIVKTPTEQDDRLPPLMREVLGYDFYTYVDETPLELDSAYGPEMAQKYNLKMARLAWDIAQLLKKLQALNPAEKAAMNGAPKVVDATPLAAAAPKPTVYLAESSYDRREVRESLHSELQLNGYRVLPDRQLPRDEAEYVAETRRLLAECQLSVHLIGNSYGAVPDGPGQKSIVVLQNELAIERCRAAGLRRVIWLPDGASSSNPEQQRFIEALQHDRQVQFGADLITSDIETLKSSVRAALRKLEKPAAAAGALPQAGEASRMVYLICDEKDRSATVPVRKFLRTAGIEVRIPVFDGDAAALRRANEESLTQCDAVLVFYGAAGEAWRRTVDSDVKKNGYRREKPLSVSSVYLAPPANNDKSDLVEMEEANLINGLGGLDPAAMGPFVDAVRRGAR
jgi:hypothetical protein